MRCGRKLSEETKKKIRDGNRGKVRSEKTRLRISANHANFNGINNPMFGKHHSEQARRKMSKARLGRKLSENHKRKIREANLGRKHTEKTKKKMSETRSKGIASGKIEINLSKKWCDTSIEIIIEKKLKKLEVTFEKQKYIKNVGFVDFFLPDYDIIIECDGDYFHNLEGSQLKDPTRDLNSMFCHQYKTIRFWEHEINESSEKCVKRIKNLIKKVAS